MLAVTANAPAGTMIGQVERDVAVWRGIPYAQPPVGPLRWRAPQPLPRRTTPLVTKTFGSICPQADPKGDAGVGIEPQSEDCLTLNIWAPSAGGAKRPVMVWLHGGGYTGGSGSAKLYEGRALARRGVVVVTLNYRLGRLGFFAHPGANPSEGANFGLLDQRAALSWVRNNIAAFGGDPKRITLFGNSAGGESVLFHMTSPGSRALFQRAIVQSGLGGRVLRTAATSVDIDRAATPIAELRTLPADSVLGWGQPSLYRGFGPVIDDVTITQDIEASFRGQRQAHVPLIIGYNSNEFPAAFLGGPTGGIALVGHDAAEQARAAAAYGSIDAYRQRIASDALFRAPALRLARLHAASGAPTWVYEFDVLAVAATALLSGAPHASERAYVFGSLPTLSWKTDAEDAAIGRDLGDRWVAFAKGGAPSWSRKSAFRFARQGAKPQPPLTPAHERYFGL